MICIMPVWLLKRNAKLEAPIKKYVPAGLVVGQAPSRSVNFFCITEPLDVLSKDNCASKVIIKQHGNISSEICVYF